MEFTFSLQECNYIVQDDGCHDKGPKNLEGGFKLELP